MFDFQMSLLIRTTAVAAFLALTGVELMSVQGAASFVALCLATGAIRIV